MADRARRELGVAPRGVVADIEKKLAVLDGELARHEELLSERERLRAARAALLGEKTTPGQTGQPTLLLKAFLAEGGSDEATGTGNLSGRDST
jgi:hypothetical protein